MDTTILTVIATGIAIVTITYTFLRNFKIDVIQKIDKLDEKVTDIDRRLCRLEGAFSSKDCCRIQDERHLKQAE
jgi:hypothetical protein